MYVLNKINCWILINDNLLGMIINCSNFKNNVDLNVINFVTLE